MKLRFRNSRFSTVWIVFISLACRTWGFSVSEGRGRSLSALGNSVFGGGVLANFFIFQLTSVAQCSSLSQSLGTSTQNQEKVLPPPPESLRSPRFIKELTMLNRQSCLSKILCGVEVSQPPSTSTSTINDYAYLVKSFFDELSIQGSVKNALNVQDDASDDDDDDNEENDDVEDDISSDPDQRMEYKKRRRNSKRPMNSHTAFFDKELDQMNDMPLEELLGGDGLDFKRRRGKTGLGNYTHNIQLGNNTNLNLTKSFHLPRASRFGPSRRGYMGYSNPRFDKTSFLNKKQLELSQAITDKDQMKIAAEIVAKMRSARQCRLLGWLRPTYTSTTTITTTSNNPAAPGVSVNAAGLSVNQPGVSVNQPGVSVAQGTSSSMCPFSGAELQAMIVGSQAVATVAPKLTTNRVKPVRPTNAAAIIPARDPAVKPVKVQILTPIRAPIARPTRKPISYSSPIPTTIATTAAPTNLFSDYFDDEKIVGPLEIIPELDGASSYYRPEDDEQLDLYGNPHGDVLPSKFHLRPKPTTKAPDFHFRPKPTLKPRPGPSKILNKLQKRPNSNLRPPPRHPNNPNSYPPPEHQDNPNSRPPPWYSNNQNSHPPSPPWHPNNPNSRPPPEYQNNLNTHPPPRYPNNPNSRPPQGYQNDPESRPPPGYQNNPDSRPPPGYQNNPNSRPPPEHQNSPDSRPPPEYLNNPDSRPPPRYPNNPNSRPPQGYQNDPESRPPPEYQNRPDTRPPPWNPNAPNSRPPLPFLNTPNSRPPHLKYPKKKLTPTHSYGLLSYKPTPNPKLSWTTTTPRPWAGLAFSDNVPQYAYKKPREGYRIHGGSESVPVDFRFKSGIDHDMEDDDNSVEDSGEDNSEEVSKLNSKADSGRMDFNGNSDEAEPAEDENDDEPEDSKMKQNKSEVEKINDESQESDEDQKNNGVNENELTNTVGQSIKQNDKDNDEKDQKSSEENSKTKENESGEESQESEEDSEQRNKEKARKIIKHSENNPARSRNNNTKPTSTESSTTNKPQIPPPSGGILSNILSDHGKRTLTRISNIFKYRSKSAAPERSLDKSSQPPKKSPEPKTPKDKKPMLKREKNKAQNNQDASKGSSEEQEMPFYPHKRPFPKPQRPPQIKPILIEDGESWEDDTPEEEEFFEKKKRAKTTERPEKYDYDDDDLSKESKSVETTNTQDELDFGPGQKINTEYSDVVSGFLKPGDRLVGKDRYVSGLPSSWESIYEEMKKTEKDKNAKSSEEIDDDGNSGESDEDDEEDGNQRQPQHQPMID